MTAPYIAQMPGMSRGLLDSLQAVAGPATVDTLPDDLKRRIGYDKEGVGGWYDAQGNVVYIHPRKGTPQILAHEFGHRVLQTTPGVRNSQTGAETFGQEMMRRTGRPVREINPLAVASDAARGDTPDIHELRRLFDILMRERLAGPQRP